MKVITAESAITYNHLTCIGVGTPCVLTDNKYLHGIYNTIYYFLHFGKVDDKNYVVPFKDNLLLPTVERAIIDYIRYESIRDEGTLIWALQDYINDERYDMDKIYEVADFYNVSREEVDYWFKEAREDDYYSMG